MKPKLFVAITILLCSSAFANDLTLTRISVTGTETTDPAVVRQAFLEVAVGDTMPELTLVEAAELARHRLVALGYFSSVDVLVIRSKSRPGTAALVAEVTEGFTGRYGGGPYWARIGTANLGGQGQDVDLWLGWNRQAAGWTNRESGLPGLTWTVEGGNRPRSWTNEAGTDQEDHLLGASFTVAQDWGWGWETGVSLAGGTVADPAYRGFTPEAGPRAWVQYRRLAPGFSPDRGILLKGEARAVYPGLLTWTQADLRLYAPLGAGFKGALRVATTVRTGPSSPRNAVVLSGLDGVRKAFDPSDLGKGAAWTSAELRWALPAGATSGFVDLEPALVLDAGAGWTSASFGDRTQAWAVGGALRVFFGAPVWVPLRLELTIDNKSRVRLGFGASAPF